jgi:hypothetical protein
VVPLAGLAVLVLSCAVGVLLAPVIADDPVVSWPRAGERPRSTVLPLVPYRPLSLDATVPCAALAVLDARGSGGEALRTVPDQSRRAAQGLILSDPGLVVAARYGIVTVSASGTTVLREVLPGPGCTYRVIADTAGVRVLRDGVRRAAASLRVPEVSELATDLDGQAEASGLAVTLHTDARYESRPTTLKIALLVAHGVALLLLLVLGWRRWPGHPQPGHPQPGHPQPARPSTLTAGRARVHPADAVLVAVSALWVLLAPTNFDDPWYLLMARAANQSGSVGNAIYMFNVTENPFVASQYVLQLWGWLGGWGLAWMRLVPLSYGLLTWVLLRVLLVRMLGPQRGAGRVVWALLGGYLLWWLPYGITLRPEPLIVLLAAATLLLAELAHRRRSVGALAAATASAALALSVSPSGLVAAAPLVLALPWLWTWLRARSMRTRLATLLLLAAATTSLVPVGFADATLGDVLESSAVHQWYYQTFSWYQEFVHYQTILSFKDSSQWARRAPIVLTIAVLLTVALARVRAPRPEPASRDPLDALLARSAACSAIALVLLAPTPTKFVNHFGAAAAAPTVLLAAALLRSPLPRAQLRTGSRGERGRFLAATALLVGAVSLSFAGPNLWRPYSDRGQPYGDHLAAAQEHADLASLRPSLGPVQLANPLLWVAVAAGTGYWAWRRQQRGGDAPGLTPDRAVLLAGSVTLVALTVVVFVWAPLRQYPGWSVALSSIGSARGHPCLLADYVQVLTDAPAQPVPTGPAFTTGEFDAAAGVPAPVPPPYPGSLVWHDAMEQGPRTGMLITGWFTLPPGGTHLLVPLLGKRAGQQLILQYATGTGPNPPVAGSAALAVDYTVPPTQWQQAVLPLQRLGPQRPTAVRLVIRDRLSGPRSWLAVGQPRLAQWRPLSALTTGRLVYVDQVTATLLPCLDQVTVRHGIAQAPQVLVLGDEGFTRHFLDLAFELWRGGTLVPVSRSASTVRVPSRLVPSGPPSLPWGRVERVVYDHPVGLVDLHLTQTRRTGWTRLPTLADKSYHGEL